MKALKISPEALVFRECVVGEADTLDVWALNTSGRPQVIKFAVPPNSPFKIPLNKGGITPHSLEAKTTITYVPKSNEVVKGTLIVKFTNGEIILPITAYPKCPAVTLSSTDIDMGNIPINNKISEKFSITNYSSVETKMKVTSNNKNLTIVNPERVLHPGRKDDVLFTVSSKEAGQVNAILKVEVEGVIEPIPNITVKANIIGTPLQFWYENKCIDDLNFGKIYSGQKKVLGVTIKNPDKAVRSFAISHITESASVSDHDPTKIFQAIPLEGVLQPNAETQINLLFSPPLQNFENDIESVFTHSLKIDVLETRQVSEISLMGASVGIFATFDPVDFNFGRQIVNTTVTKKLTITNDSSFLPIDVTLKNVAQFRFVPENLVIPPQKSKTMNINFYPRNMGEFVHNIPILINNGLSQKMLHFSGIAVKKDLEQKKFIRPDVWSIVPDAQYAREHPVSAFGLDEIELNEKLKKREQFDKYITDSAEKRSEHTMKTKLYQELSTQAKEYLSMTKSNFNEDDVKEIVDAELKKGGRQDPNFGITYGEGLDEPDPGFMSEKKTEKVSQNTTQNTSNYLTEIQTGRLRLKPTTPPEINECSRKLSPAQQLSVLCSLNAINFGVVSVYSTQSKEITITNNLQQNIFVEFKIGDEELKDSNPLTQVIPPLQTATFMIVFSTTKEQTFNKTISYVVNNFHKYQINIAAQSIPIEMRLSKKEINFGFGYGQTKFECSETVTLFNNSNAVAHYTWRNITKPFSIQHEQGSIQPQAKEDIVLFYTPEQVQHSECTATLFVVGGLQRTLNLIGDTGKSKIVIPKKTVDLGLIPLGVQQNAVIKLKNTGVDDALFKLNYPDLIGLSINPRYGRIVSNEIKQLNVSYSCSTAGDFTHPVTIDIAGTSPVKINIQGSGQIPFVSIKNEPLEYGRLFIGAIEKKKISIVNKGRISAALNLDLTGYDGFNIEYAAELGQCGQDGKSNAIIMTGKENSKSYKITVIPDSNVDFMLVFQPIDVQDFTFELPISMANKDINLKEHPIVSAQAIHAPILPNTTCVDFGISPLFDSSNPNCRPSHQEVVIRNESKKPVKFRFDSQKLPKVITIDNDEGTVDYLGTTSVFFKFRPTNIIPVCCEIPLYATIETEKIIKTENSDQNEVEIIKEEVLITSLQISGVGSSRLFKTSTNYVCLPIVPCNMTSSVTIDVINFCFIQASLKAELPVNTKNIPLKVEFPQTNTLQYTVASIPLKISFCHTKPLSFSTVVALIDDKGHSYSFNVSATTDHSVFTLYPIISLNKYQISMQGGRTPFINTNIETPDYLSKYLSSNSCDEYYKIKSCITPEMLDFLRRFINKSAISSPIGDFPQDIANDPNILCDIIQNFGGKKLTLGEYHKKDYNSKLKDLSNILQNLISQGAMLSSVKPEFLLPKEDFLLFNGSRITRKLFGLDFIGAQETNTLPNEIVNNFSASQSFVNSMLKDLKALDENYTNLSNESWTLVIWQVIKLFYVSKIDTAKFNATPGFLDSLRALKSKVSEYQFNEINRIFRQGAISNVYSNQEGLVLKWLSVYYSKSVSARAIIDFHELQDVSIIGNVVDSHVSKPLFESSQKDPGSLVSILNELKSNVALTSIDFVKGDCPTLALISIQLYMSLPYFIPGSNVEFKTPLNTSLIQNVTISNTSNRDILYTAKLEGSKNFSLVQNTITLQAHESAEFSIEYFSRTHEPETARLTLTPERPKAIFRSDSQSSTPIISPKSQTISSQTTKSKLGLSKTMTNGIVPTFASTIVVDLVSNTQITLPKNTITIETEMYKQKKVDLEIPNVIKKTGNYKLYSKTFEYTTSSEQCSKQLQMFLNDLSIEGDIIESKHPFENYINKHKSFIFSQREISFVKENSNAKVSVEYIPISMKKLRCFLIFHNQNIGEFVYEIVGNPLLPVPSADLTGQLKVECKHKVSTNVNIDSCNNNLMWALAYSSERVNNLANYISERKLRELVTIKQREVTHVFTQSFQTQTFTIQSSSTFFSVPEQYISMNDKVKDKGISISFTPTKPGEYPCKVVMMSNYDVRVYTVKGIGLANTQSFSIEFNMVAGQQLQQEIPFENTSKRIWEFKASVSGLSNSMFTVPNRFSVPAEGVFQLPVIFSCKQIGDFKVDLTVTNMTKEAVTVYKLIAHVQEPPANEKIKFAAVARKTCPHKLKVECFTKGTVNVSTDLPIVDVPKTFEFKKQGEIQEMPFKIYSVQSGICAGTITFTDPSNGYYQWYIIEVDVDRPPPEQTIEVSTVARQSATVSIPITNDNDTEMEFDVDFDDTDFFGLKKFKVAGKTTTEYKLIFSPLTQFDKTSSISFSNESQGEFIYNLELHVSQPETSVIAPLTAPVGQYASYFITIENPLNKKANFVIRDDENNSFVILGKKMFSLNPFEKKQIEIRYIPSCVGVKESGNIYVKSNDIGEWFYTVSGIGKPPQPLSPVIVEGLVMSPTSAIAIFKNPFNRPVKTQWSLTSSSEFKLLTKKRQHFFRLYNEELQIPFSFAPKTAGQFVGSIVIDTESVRWSIPIIGNASTAEGNINPVMKGHAYSEIAIDIDLPLVGEKESYQPNDYIITPQFAEGYEFLRSIFEIKPEKVTTSNENIHLHLKAKMHPRRPIETSVDVTVVNQLGQKWHFVIQISVLPGKPIQSIILKCVLNQCVKQRVKVPSFPIRTPFRAYFAGGSAAEFTVSPGRGYIEASTEDETEVPCDIIFEPKMYGKVLKGLLVIDTLEREFLFELEGLMPKYHSPEFEGNEKDPNETFTRLNGTKSARTNILGKCQKSFRRTEWCIYKEKFF
ncbi:hypothetical protein TVAG_373180 [Trichomonas vaginalis G3]|uniref:Calponin-homology (CH) domain-containing protein n=1 Tax=Trichomonas vaginalis (strain ATCC PRA-98 / G3) TaxID=412133 RepID=A2DZI1_TRIV3|nr:cilia- and flagella-associated protein 47 family [Trichomonas vaginalis G3]EAY14185.1 hypothetical protein TVAG_373180 [Trichomonas vaginalis G3]KAI5539179.1 cilia- and flagella-associated protein 47 family [Trichomonas vaginalis G3]|eukprot:XP_001326408.1 hypothetical protein [Trichomonas vaginalis G3]